MHADLREAIIASVRRRFEQGDCPTEPAHTVEMLEHVILDLARTPPAGGDAGDGEPLHEVLQASLAKRSVAAMGDKVWSAAFNAALDMVARDTAAALALPAPVVEGDGLYVAGPIWAEEDDDCFTAEIQISGGHYVVATVHGATRDQVEQRQRVILAALSEGRTDA